MLIYTKNNTSTLPKEDICSNINQKREKSLEIDYESDGHILFYYYLLIGYIWELHFFYYIGI
jgi:hypothetical protein